MKKAIIYADYGSGTGIGHIMRCGTLAKELSSVFQIHFACEENGYSGFVAETAKKAGAGIQIIDNMSDLTGEVVADLFIIDSYKTTTSFLKSAKSTYEICAVIDDNALLSFYDCDILINQNVGAENLNYSYRKDTKPMLGINYLMLREEFVKAKPIDITKEVKNIVITMGGGDYKNTTAKILKLVEKHAAYTYDVVIGSDFENREELVKISEASKNIVLHENADMPSLFSNCQAAISATGTTIYELASMGIPTIGVITADNQKNVSIGMENLGIILSAGLEEKLSDWYLDELFSDVVANGEFRRGMHKKQLETVKKNGATSIKKGILERF